MLWFRKIMLRRYVPRTLPPLKEKQSHRMIDQGYHPYTPCWLFSRADSFLVD